ncbi:MAG: hypothetical protein JJ921_11640 [Pseudomonadales bacterium]|nr:hypothetical protein [Pseudomonadales bacterium]
MFSHLQQHLPLPAAAFLLALIVPPELSIELGGLRLSSYRIVLLILFIPMLYQLLLNPNNKPTFADWGMVFVSAWCCIALVIHQPFVEAIEKGGILIVEMFGAYLIARTYITRYEQLVAVAQLMTLLVGAVLIVSIPESLSGVHFLRGSEIKIYPERIGLHRAYGPFDHPILHGVVCAAAFSYAYYLCGSHIKRNNRFPALIVCGATFFSLSAGPFIALATQVALTVWDKLSHGLKARWWFVIGTICSGYLIIDLLSNRSPVAFIISHLSFSGQTAYMRLLIFDYGSAEVLRHPIIGIGFNDWIRPSWMPPSVDNFWLLTAMRYGLPALCGITAILLYMVVKIANTPGSGRVRDAGRAWGFTMASFAVVGCTVHFWNATFVLFFFLLGSGCWMLNARSAASSMITAIAMPLNYQPRNTLF